MYVSVKKKVQVESKSKRSHRRKKSLEGEADVSSSLSSLKGRSRETGVCGGGSGSVSVREVKKEEVSWCSRLSRLLYTQKDLGSIPSGTILALRRGQEGGRCVACVSRS